MHKALPLEDRKVRQHRLHECVGIPAVEYIAQVPLFYVCSFVWFMKYLGKLSCCHGGCCSDGLLPFKIVCSDISEGPAAPIVGVNLFQEEATRSSETSEQTLSCTGDHFQYWQRKPAPQLHQNLFLFTLSM